VGKKPAVIVVLDSNVFFSALITPKGTSASIYSSWRANSFHLVTYAEQIEEIKTASKNPKFADLLQPQEVGIMLNNLQKVKILQRIPRRHSASDPTDAFLLDLATFASAHFLVTGDKRSGLLQRRRVEGTRILSPAQFCASVLQSS
jgi:putative PIN family toxin of toxin-antitoxin system